MCHRLCDKLNANFSRELHFTKYLPGATRAWKLIENSFMILSSQMEKPQSLVVYFIVNKSHTIISLNNGPEMIVDVSIDALDACVEKAKSEGLKVEVFEEDKGNPEEKIFFFFTFTPSNI